MTSTDHLLGEGDLLETVMVGPPVRGHFATWHDDGRRLWVLDDPAEQSELIGTGRLARTLREPRRYREVVLVGDAMVLGMERTAPSDDGTVTMGSIVLASRRVELGPKDADEAAWHEFAGWLTGVVLGAAERGEVVVLEAGGAEYTDEPFVLAVPAPTDDGGVMHIERAPASVAAEGWPPAGQVEGQTISAPITPDTIELVGPLMTFAARTWAHSPHDVCLTFADTSPADSARSTRVIGVPSDSRSFPTR